MPDAARADTARADAAPGWYSPHAGGSIRGSARGSARGIFAVPQQLSSRLVRYDGGPAPWSPRQERYQPVHHLQYTSREFHVTTYREVALLHDGGGDDDDPAPFASARGSAPPPRTRERSGSLTLTASTTSFGESDTTPRTYPVPIPVRSPAPQSRYTRALDRPHTGNGT